MWDWNLDAESLAHGALLTLYRRERGSVSLSPTPGIAAVGDELLYYVALEGVSRVSSPTLCLKFRRRLYRSLALMRDTAVSQNKATLSPIRAATGIS